MVIISLTLGKFLSIIGLLNNKVEAKIGNDAFFDPEILTLPLTLQGPLIRNFCINYFLIFATWIVV